MTGKDNKKKSDSSAVRKRRSANKESKKSSRKRVEKPFKADKKSKTELQKFCDEAKKVTKEFIRRHPVIFLVASAVLALLAALYFIDESLDLSRVKQNLPEVTDNVSKYLKKYIPKFTIIFCQVSMNFSMNGRPMGEVSFGLYGRRCPLTVSNFVMLAAHEKGFGYSGSRIHKVIQNYLIAVSKNISFTKRGE